MIRKVRHDFCCCCCCRCCRCCCCCRSWLFLSPWKRNGTRLSLGIVRSHAKKANDREKNGNNLHIFHSNGRCYCAGTGTGTAGIDTGSGGSVTGSGTGSGGIAASPASPVAAPSLLFLFPSPTFPLPALLLHYHYSIIYFD